MSRPIIQIGTETREMTEAEFSQWQLDVQEAEATRAAKAARIAARESALAKLSALGLSEAEITALVGA
jgi:hypothetical protein